MVYISTGHSYGGKVCAFQDWDDSHVRLGTRIFSGLVDHKNQLLLGLPVGHRLGSWAINSRSREVPQVFLGWPTDFRKIL